LSTLTWEAGIAQQHKLTPAEQASVAAIEAELRVLRLGEASAIDTVLPEVRRLVGTQTILVVTPVERGDGLAIDRFHSDNFDDPEHVKRTFARFFETAPTRYAWYDAVRPEPEQRNKVLEAHDLMGPGEFESSTVYQQVLVPTGLHQDRQPRILLCEGPSLLAWFGAFHPDRVEPRHKKFLALLAPALRERLIIERRLESAPRTAAALEVALDQLGAPALVVGPTGVVLEANEAARALIETRTDVRTALRERLAGRPASLPFELISLRERGAPDAWLAILPPRSPDERIRASIARAITRWRLTKRQVEVLERVIDGHTNASIAAVLGVTVRAVELHVTALFDRAGVNSRGALVARVLLES
jgi:DNA-binding CsgD family transcriptional regulator